MSTRQIEALAAAVIATTFVGIAFLARRNRVRNWHGYLVGAGLGYVYMVLALLGISIGART